MDLWQKFSNPLAEPSDSALDAVYAAPASPPDVVTIYDLLDHDEEYSPTSPGYVFSGDWEEFCNFDLVSSMDVLTVQLV